MVAFKFKFTSRSTSKVLNGAALELDHARRRHITTNLTALEIRYAAYTMSATPITRGIHAALSPSTCLPFWVRYATSENQPKLPAITPSAQKNPSIVVISGNHSGKVDPMITTQV